MKAWLVALGLLATGLQAQNKIDSLYPATPTNYVNDLTSTLNPTELANLNAQIQHLRDSTRLEVAVAILPTIGDYQPYEVALAIGRKWGVGAKAEIGDPTRNNGIVILIVPRKGEVRGKCFIATGRGVEGFITDATAGDICRTDMAPLMRAGNYAGGLAAGLNRILSIGSNNLYPKHVIKHPVPEAPDFFWAYIFGILIIGIVALMYARHEHKLKLEEAETERRLEEARLLAERVRAERERKEKLRWEALSPAQQQAELQARKDAARKAQEEYQEVERRRRKRQKEYEQRRREEYTPPPIIDNSSSSSSSYSSDSSSSSSDFGGFGGGGGFSGGGGGSDI